MAPDEYSKALDKALADLQHRVQQRDLLVAEIAGLKETLRVLSTLVQMDSDKQREVAKLLAMADYATPSLTDAIRSLLLRESPKEMTAIEVRDALEDSSNSEDFSNSLSAIHAALKRMLSDKEIEAGAPKNGKASYRRVIHIAKPHDSYATILGAGILANPLLPPIGKPITGKTIGQRMAEPDRKPGEAPVPPRRITPFGQRIVKKD